MSRDECLHQRPERNETSVMVMVYQALTLIVNIAVWPEFRGPRGPSMFQEVPMGSRLTAAPIRLRSHTLIVSPASAWMGGPVSREMGNERGSTNSPTEPH
jgi:hypothetical protein